MKPIGVPRNLNLENPDLGDSKEFGMKSSKTNLPGKGGDIKSNFRKPEQKAATRRTFKRKARAEGKDQCKDTE